MDNDRAIVCDHNFTFLLSTFEMTDGTYKCNYKQTDTFYCTKCLQYEQRISRNVDERSMPNWFKG